MDKKTRRMVNETKSSLKNSEIISHPSFENFLNRENRNIFKQWMIPQKKVFIQNKRSAEVACTDNKNIYINASANIFKADREEAILRIYGVTFHEIGHILFTSYTGLANYIKNIESGILWPANPKTELDTNLNELLEYISHPNKAKNLAAILKMLANCLEDPRIENMLNNYCEKCEKYKKGLAATQKWLFDNSMPSLMEMKSNPDQCEATILNQLIFNYARFNTVSGYNESYEEDELYQLLMKCIDHIKKAVNSKRSSEFYNNLNNIIVICWPVYKRFLDDIQEENNPKKDYSSNGEDKNSSKNDDNSSGSENGSDSSGNGDSKKNSDSDDESDSDNKSENNSFEETDNNKNDSEEKSEKSSSNNKENNDADDEDVSDAIRKALEKAIEGMTPNHNDEEDRKNDKGSDDKKISDKIEEGDKKREARIEYEKTDSIRSGEKGFSKKDFIDKEGERIDLDALINRIAKEKVDDTLSEEKLRMLKETSDNLEYSDMNKNVSIELLSPKVTDSMKKEYNSDEMKYLVKLGKEIAKKIQKSLPQEKEPIVLKNRVIGTKFNASSVARNDLRYYSKKTKPEEGPSLTLGLVVDESGSMCSSKRDQYAKAAAVALYACAETLDIPTCIYGHTADIRGYDVNIINYTDFEHPQSNDKYKLMNIQARANNRDAVPVQFVAERLLESECDKKLLIIISDGQPMASGYTGTAADKDLQHTVKKYSKKGITIIAAAIGNDKENIKRIYGEHRFLDISDLASLPREMLKVIKRNMK